MSVRYSCPEWILDLWQQEYGEEKTEIMLRSLQEEHPLTIRCCRNRISVEELRSRLEEEGVKSESHPHLPYALSISGYDYLEGLETFREGFFAVQDVSSMLVGELAAPRAGAQVLDVCAAPGGKSAYLCEQMQLTGRVYAWELHEKRAQLLEGVRRRLGLDNLRISVRDALDFRPDLEGALDGVLLDAPCAGLGVLSQKPDIKLRLKEEDIPAIVDTQGRLIDTVCRYVRPGGALVYSTCSLLPEENADRVRAFLQAHPNFTLEPLPTSFPEELRARLQGLQQEKLTLEQQRTALNRETQSRNDAVLAAQGELSRLEQKRSAAAMEEKTILDKLWERYELSHSEAQAQRVELESVPKATRRIGELNRAIKALGTPNIGAIEEYDRVNGRYTYLSDQRADVEQAKGELTGVIDQLTRQMTEIFARQFKLLNDSFQETFLELFGGGKARLELEDERDILNCGIEIKVQPPGKQLKTITLLSGGEKAFVAIALYFAILKVHPTPFCVMDEIEAALDEANVVRYARYMRRIAGKTQFIVITHRRGTMEEADVLYGVTMQERGVSRILTINLNDMAKELNIK